MAGDYPYSGDSYDYAQGQIVQIEQQVQDIASQTTSTALPAGASGQVYVVDGSGNPTAANVSGDSNGLGLSVTGSGLVGTLTQDLKTSATPTFASLLLTAFLRFSGSAQALSGAGAIDVVSAITHWTTTGANAGTLADGAQGQIKIVVMIVDAGDGTLTPTNAGGYTTITFNDVGDAAILLFTNSKWYVIAAHGVTVA